MLGSRTKINEMSSRAEQEIWKNKKEEELKKLREGGKSILDFYHQQR